MSQSLCREHCYTASLSDLPLAADLFVCECKMHRVIETESKGHTAASNSPVWNPMSSLFIAKCSVSSEAETYAQCCNSYSPIQTKDKQFCNSLQKSARRKYEYSCTAVTVIEFSLPSFVLLCSDIGVLLSQASLTIGRMKLFPWLDSSPLRYAQKYPFFLHIYTAVSN